MINGIDLGKLRNAELLQLMKNTASLVAANDTTVLNVVAQHTALQNQINALDTLFRISQANEITQELFDIDTSRDNCITGIGKVVEGYMSHFDTSIAMAAKRLNDSLALYGERISKQNYQSETATLNAIISDWETKPELTAAMNTLHLEEWKDKMKTYNTLFDEKYLTRTQDYGAANPDTIKAEREETNQAYYKLRDRITGFATVLDNPNAAYAKTINELNALIDQYNTLLSNRVPETPETPSA
ncbi:DUF6261 family protein [Flavobacterium sp. 3HN19-14]|uniref:DUF6261 family protein n=1 Tax=Flavobacterium sp. 3HN19-14 TaxID=3448133 RepID=UPI003EDFAB1B